MVLKFTPSSIADIEKENGNVAYSTLLVSGTMISLRCFVKAGLGDQDFTRADAEIKAFMASGRSLNDLGEIIMQSLEDDHFLEAGALEATRVGRAMLNQEKARMIGTEIYQKFLSPNSGEETKSEPSISA